MNGLAEVAKKLTQEPKVAGNFNFPAALTQTKKAQKRDVSELFLFKCPQLLIFPARRQASIFSVDELNFCVRHGNRWNLIAIVTD